MPRNGAESVLMHLTRTFRRGLPCNWLRCHPKPSIFCHPYTLVISREDAKALVVISAQAISKAVLDNAMLYNTDF